MRTYPCYRAVCVKNHVCRLSPCFKREGLLREWRRPCLNLKLSVWGWRSSRKVPAPSKTRTPRLPSVQLTNLGLDVYGPSLQGVVSPLHPLNIAPKTKVGRYDLVD